MRRFSRFLVSFVLAGAAAGAALAGAAPLPAGVSLKITPASGIDQCDDVYLYIDVGPGGPVDAELSVTPPAASGHRPVTIHLTGIQGALVHDFNQTRYRGTYKVRLSVPARQQAASGAFNVEAGSCGAQDQDEEDKLGPVAKEALASAQNCLSALQDSPARQELTAKLAELRSRLGDEAAHLDGLQQAMDGASKLVDGSRIDEAYPEAGPLFAPLKAKLKEWSDGAESRVKAVHDALQASATKKETCERLDCVVEALKSVSSLLEIAGQPATILKDWAQGARAGVAPAHFTSAELGAVLDARLRATTRAAEDSQAWFTAAKALADADAAYAGSRVAARYCQKFEGPFSATMHAEIVENGQVWWKYDIELAGTLVLRYPNPASTDAGGGPLRLTGEFEGDATKFTLWEDAIHVFSSKLMMAGTLYVHRYEYPLPEFEGRRSTAAHFVIPVRGTLTDDTLGLTLQEPSQDYGEPTVHVTYVVGSPLSIGLQVVKYDLPYQSGGFVMDRLLGKQAVDFKVSVDRKGELMTIARDFTAERGKLGGATGASYRLSVKACNPQCP